MKEPTFAVEQGSATSISADTTNYCASNVDLRSTPRVELPPCIDGHGVAMFIYVENSGSPAIRCSAAIRVVRLQSRVIKYTEMLI